MLHLPKQRIRQDEIRIKVQILVTKIITYVIVKNTRSQEL